MENTKNADLSAYEKEFCKMKRRTYALLLALALSASLLTACGGNSGSSSSSQPENSVPSSQTGDQSQPDASLPDSSLSDGSASPARSGAPPGRESAPPCSRRSAGSGPALPDSGYPS